MKTLGFLSSLLFSMALGLSASASASDISWNTINGGGATFSTGGNFSLGGTIGQPDAGALNGTGFELNGGFWATTNFATIQVLSGPVANPNPATTGQQVQFAITNNFSDTVFTWNFGDGTPAVVGNPVVHTFIAAGTYSATVNGLHAPSDQTINTGVLVTVTDGGGGGGGGGNLADSDGDGFIDELEIGYGSSPSDGNSTPFGGATAGAAQPLTIAKAGLKLNFAKSGADSVTFSGTLPVSAGFSVAGKEAVAFVGGVTRKFTLSSKGTSPKGLDSFKIGIKAKKGVVAAQTSKYSVKFSKGTFAAGLADEGFTSANVKKEARSALVIVLFNNTLYQTSRPFIYTAKAGKSGSAK